MNYRKITDSDLQNVGVIGLPDTPELSTDEMQAKFEETVRSVVIPAFNRLIAQLEERDSKTYTSDEIIQLINQRVTDIGAGDMAKGVYDTDNDGVVDNAAKLGGNLPDYYMTKAGGNFTGDAFAHETARTVRSLFNNETRAYSATGDLQSVKYFIDVT